MAKLTAMNFSQYIQITAYSPVYAAQKILYEPESRPAKIAASLGLDVSTRSSRSMLSWIASGKRKMADFDFNNGSSDKNLS